MTNPGFFETFYLICEYMTIAIRSGTPPYLIRQTLEYHGHMELVQVCLSLTTDFEMEYCHESWITSDYIETLEKFLEKKFNERPE